MLFAAFTVIALILLVTYSVYAYFELIRAEKNQSRLATLALESISRKYVIEPSTVVEVHQFENDLEIHRWVYLSSKERCGWHKLEEDKP